MQSLRILDSYELVPTHLPEPSASIHRKRDFEEPAKAGGGAVVTQSKRSYDACGLLEVRLLAREQRVALEERHDSIEQVLALAHHEDERPISSTVGLDVAAPEPAADQLQYLSPVAVLVTWDSGTSWNPTRQLALRCTETEKLPSPST